MSGKNGDKGVFIIYSRGWYRRETNRKEKKNNHPPFRSTIFFPRSALQFQIQVSDSNSDSYSDLNLKRGQLSRIKCGIALSLFTE